MKRKLFSSEQLSIKVSGVGWMMTRRQFYFLTRFFARIRILAVNTSLGLPKLILFLT